MVSKVAGKLVAAGITLIFMGFGVLAYADAIKNGWEYAWLTLASQPAPFAFIDPNYVWWGIGIGFALFGVVYLFR